MKAAVLHKLGEAPKYEEFPDPVPGDGQAVIHVKAASLTHFTKGIASGKHYLSPRQDQLPIVPGADGIGVLDNGQRVYFRGSTPHNGTMAELSLVNPKLVLPIPDSLDDAAAAAMPNAAMSSWMALVHRAKLQAGETVLILGATGTSGKLAIQVAKQLGAGKVIAAGRNKQALATLGELGADDIISLEQDDQELAASFAKAAGATGFNVVLDYLWGHPAEVLIGAPIGREVNGAWAATRLIQIGSMAGPNISLPALALRGSGLEILGSGAGSVAPQEMAKIMPQVIQLAAEGKLRIDVEAVPLSEVESAWDRSALQGRKLVLIP